jgi:hypothetical protein
MASGLAWEMPGGTPGEIPGAVPWTARFLGFQAFFVFWVFCAKKTEQGFDALLRWR